MCSHSPRRAADRRSGCQSQRMLQDPWKSTSFRSSCPHKFYDVLSGWKKTHVVRWGTNIIYQFIAPIHPIKPSKTGVICTNCASAFQTLELWMLWLDVNQRAQLPPVSSISPCPLPATGLPWRYMTRCTCLRSMRQLQCGGFFQFMTPLVNQPSP